MPDDAFIYREMVVILALEARETLIKWQVRTIIVIIIHIILISFVINVVIIIVHPSEANCVYKQRRSRSYCVDLSPVQMKC